VAHLLDVKTRLRMDIYPTVCSIITRRFLIARIDSTSNVLSFVLSSGYLTFSPFRSRFFSGTVSRPVHSSEFSTTRSRLRDNHGSWRWWLIFHRISPHARTMQRHLTRIEYRDLHPI